MAGNIGFIHGNLPGVGGPSPYVGSTTASPPAPPVQGTAAGTFFAPMAMRFRRQINPANALGSDPIPHQLTRWPGPPVQPPTFFNPKLRTNTFLKSYGFPSENIRAHFERADTRAFLAHVQGRAVRIDTKSNAFGDMRGVPAVYVPTSAANNYGGKTL